MMAAFRMREPAAADDDAPQPSHMFMSSLPPGRRERRLALATVLVSVAIFVALAPFARMQLPRVWGFIPVYQSAIVVSDMPLAELASSSMMSSPFSSAGAR